MRATPSQLTEPLSFEKMTDAMQRMTDSLQRVSQEIAFLPNMRNVQFHEQFIALIKMLQEHQSEIQMFMAEQQRQIQTFMAEQQQQMRLLVQDQAAQQAVFQKQVLDLQRQIGVQGLRKVQGRQSRESQLAGFSRTCAA